LYNFENLLSAVKKMNGTCASGTVLETTSFVYDGDGNLAKKTKPDGSRTIYVGGIYEVDKTSGGSVTQTRTYYPAGGAMRVGGTLYYILKDHLDSANVVTDSTGTVVGEQRYYPYGETRFTSGTIYTDKLFTGQRDVGLGIYHYGARFRAAPPQRSGAGYSPKLGRFLSPDTIIPVFENPQSWNRFSYAINNPIRYNDPDGHCAPACVIPVVPFVALAAVITLTAIAIHPESRAAAIDSMEYISKRVLDRVDDFEENVADMNNGQDHYPSRGCRSSAGAMASCIIGAFVIAGTILYAGTHGPSGEPEAVAQRLPELVTPTSTSTPTPTQTSSPTITPTSTPSRTPTPYRTPAPSNRLIPV
jgi:RHS repeat-associated protein